MNIDTEEKIMFPVGDFSVSFDHGNTWYAMIDEGLNGPYNTKEEAEDKIKFKNLNVKDVVIQEN